MHTCKAHVHESHSTHIVDVGYVCRWQTREVREARNARNARYARNAGYARYARYARYAGYARYALVKLTGRRSAGGEASRGM